MTLPDGVELELAVSRLGEGKHAGTVITLHATSRPGAGSSARAAIWWPTCRTS